jgi:hypothetical protein
MALKKSNNNRHPGGRPEKIDKDLYGKINCVLRLDTIAQLKSGAGSRFVGEYLQAHLDRYPLPTHEQYVSSNVWTLEKYRGRKIPVIFAAPGLSKEARKLARERSRREKLSPEKRAWEDSIRESMTQLAKEKTNSEQDIVD